MERTLGRKTSFQYLQGISLNRHSFQALICRLRLNIRFVYLSCISTLPIYTDYHQSMDLRIIVWYRLARGLFTMTIRGRLKLPPTHPGLQVECLSDWLLSGFRITMLKSFRCKFCPSIDKKQLLFVCLLDKKQLLFYCQTKSNYYFIVSCSKASVRLNLEFLIGSRFLTALSLIKSDLVLIDITIYLFGS